MKRSTVSLVLLILLAGAAAGPVIAGGGNTQTLHSSPVAKERVQAHRKHYKKFGSKTGKSLRALASQGTGPIKVTVSSPPGFTVGDPDEPYFKYPHGYLRRLATSADAVVVGKLQQAASYLTEDEDFLFTDYSMHVEEVIKDNPAAPILRRGEITVTRPGGVTRIKGRTVTAVDGYFRPFHTGGRYVLFLQFLPESGAYRALSDKSFELVEEGPLRGTRGHLPRNHVESLESAKDPEAFLAEVRLAVMATLR